MSTTLASRYDPKEAQDRWYEFWEKNGYFHAEPDDRPREQRYTIVIPPPNVTGALHMGHALNNTLQDILIRWRRMQGYNTLWMPGTDHAGIATQAVVERRIREQEGKTRHDLGRDELVRRIWVWKDEYERRILNQLRRLGCSCDWRRTRFTFDEGCSRAVRETFFKMFRDGLIYRGKRLVNWDTQLQTSVADDETYTEDVKGGFWTFKYPVKEEGNQQSAISNQQFVRFSTTRPETMLGDTAVAVHPNDPRYKHLIGKLVMIPLVGREIPIIADGLLVDPELGTGCVKVTPAHDMNDYACGLRHKLPMINILNPDGTINEAGGKYAGMDRYKARDAVTADMEALGLFEGREDRMIPLKFSDRSKSPIEPYLSDQWFVRMSDAKTGVFAQHTAQETLASNLIGLELPQFKSESSQFKSESPQFKPEPSQFKPEPSQIKPEASRFKPELPQCESASPRFESELPTGKPEPQQFKAESSPGESGSSQTQGLAEMAMAAVRDGRVKIHPERYAKTYLDWLGEKRDWCISRQLWWGHRIPVWTVESMEPKYPDQKQRTARVLDLTDRVSRGERSPTIIKELASMLGPEAMTQAASSGYARLQEEFPDQLAIQHFDGKLFVCLNPSLRSESLVAMIERHGFVQDPDVLDTWFSSQLWPHSTLGWPERSVARPESAKGVAASELSGTTPFADSGCATLAALNDPDWNEMKYYYPTSVLVTSRDIITLWVARMVIAGLYNCGEVPFRDVVITPKILDGFGQTMSKTRGNGVDPLDIIDKYGADALRFAIAQMTTESQDARLPVGYECPFCQTTIAQKLEHQQMKPKALKPDAQARDGGAAVADSEDPSLARRATVVKPRIKCPSCKKDFQFSSPNFDPDPGEPVARVVSERFEQGRNFANKLWNAARFALMNLEGYSVARPESAKGVAEGATLSTTPFADSGRATPSVMDTIADEERWILSRLAATVTEVTEHLENFRYSEVAKSLYEFSWSEFCDWYVEMAKLRLKNPATRATAQSVLATVLDNLLRLLHPVMPFLTEQIWQALADLAPQRGLDKPEPAAASVMIAPWPVAPSEWRNLEIEKRMARLQELIKSIRNIRSNFNVDNRSPVAAHVRCSPAVAAELRAATPFIEQLASVNSFEAGPDVAKPADSASAVANDWELYVPLTGLIDRPAEIERNRKLLDSIAAQLKSFQSKLANADFVAKAPPDVVELHRQRVSELTAQKASVEEILRELGGAK